jgi:hypothetical protein
MSTAVENFLASPTVNSVKKLKKAELLEVAKTLELTEVTNSMKRNEILRHIAEYYAEDGVFTMEEMSLFKEPSSIEEKSMSEMELKIKMMELELQQQEKQRQFELEKLAREEKQRLIELEEREKQRQFELEKLKLGVGVQKHHAEPHFVASREVRLVPPFDETEVDKYFQHFEKVAESLKWPKEFWPLLLQSVIKGKAQQAYSALSIEEAGNYVTVKEAILKAYELVPEAYRQKFRNLRKRDNQTFVEFAYEKEVYFERWCSSMSVNGDFEKLQDLVLVEEFKRCVKDDIKSYLDEKDALTLQKAAKLADEYTLTHKSKFSATDKSNFKKKEISSRPNFQHTESKAKANENQSQKDKTTGPVCNYCKKVGHALSDCWVLKKKKEKESSPNALVKSYTETLTECVVPTEPLCPSKTEKSFMSIF